MPATPEQFQRIFPASARGQARAAGYGLGLTQPDLTPLAAVALQTSA